MRKDITERRRLEKRRHTILEVHDAGLDIRANSEDIEQGLPGLPDALRELAVPFEAYGVNLIDPESNDTSVWFHRMRTDKR